MYLYGRSVLLVSSTSWIGFGIFSFFGVCLGIWLSLCFFFNVFGDIGVFMREGTALSWEEKYLENGYDIVFFFCRG